MKIVPVNIPGYSATGRLDKSLSVGDIIKTLGFEPNCKDDPSKVKYSWGFEVDGVRCGIWDYKRTRWSTFGPAKVFQELFGDRYNP